MLPQHTDWVPNQVFETSEVSILLPKMRNIVLLTVSLIIAHTAMAQETTIDPPSSHSLWFGLMGGGNLVAHSTGTIQPLNSEPDMEFINGSGTTGWAGIAMEYPVGNFLENQAFVVLDVIFDSKSSDMGSINASYGPNGSFYQARGRVELNYYDLNIAFKYNFFAAPEPAGIGLQLGVAAGISGTSKFSYMLSDPNTMETIAQSDSTIPGAKSLRLAIRPAITYDLPLFRNFTTELIAGTDIPLTKVTNTYNWTTLSLFFGIGLFYRIGQ
jgi:hypothetical protein